MDQLQGWAERSRSLIDFTRTAPADSAGNPVPPGPVSPKPTNPDAVLTVVSQVGPTVTASSSGTKPAPSSKLKTWEMDWADGTKETGTGAPPTTFNVHVYAQGAQDVTYHALLRVVDKNGRSDTDTKNITVPALAGAPVDCVLGPKVYGAPIIGTCQPSNTQSVTTPWTRTILVQPANGGAACGPTSGVEVTSQACVYVPPDPGDQRVLTKGDLTWLGTFKSPAALSGSGNVDRPYFTLRRVGGVLKCLWLSGPVGAGALRVIQSDYPGYSATFASAPDSLTGVRDLGNGHLAHCKNEDGSAKSNILYGGICWDNRNNCLWITYGDSYNAGGVLADPVLIRGDFTDANPDASVIAWSGPWRFKGSAAGTPATPSCSQTQSHITTVPQAFGDAYLGGASIALGGDFISQSSPYGNNLWAIQTTPTSSTPPHSGVSGLGGTVATDLQAVALLGGDRFGHRGTRPGDYITEFCQGDISPNGDTDPTSFTRGALTGLFTVMERSGASVWIDWDTVRGVLFLVQHGRGHIWYNTASTQQCNHGVIDRYSVQGPESVVSKGNGSFGLGSPPQTVDDTGLAYGSGPDQELALYIYDPQSFAPVTSGNIWQVPVADWTYLRDQYPSVVVNQAEGEYCIIRPNGLAADETARLIMVPCAIILSPTWTVGFYVNVFAVAP